jgi:uroporphyrinogen-III synthase
VFNEARHAELRRLLDCDSLWIITSSEALRYLVDMARQLGTEESVAKLQRKNLLVPHVRIKETACALGFTRICLTGSGDEAMLAALQFRG